MEKENIRALADDVREVLRKEYAHLKEQVFILGFISEEENRPFNQFTEMLLNELSELSDKIKVSIKTKDSDEARQYNVDRTPTILLQPGKYSIRFIGTPAGEEAKTFFLAIAMVSGGMSILSTASKERLNSLKDKRNVKVFVSPTCPYCPVQTALAISAAIERPYKISTEIIEIYENKDLAAKYNAFSVPQVFIDDKLAGLGLQPEEVLVEEIISAAPVKTKPPEYAEQIKKDLLIVGAGPAGLTAAIYAARSGLDTIVIEKANIGGKVAITPVVENYPGFTKIAGKTLMDMMAQQAIHYVDIHEGEEVMEILKKDDIFEVKTNRIKYLVSAVLITTGADSKKLGIPGEESFQGRGVSYCAICDGYFFKDGKKVIVVGGGNAAIIDALHLKNIGADVTLIHRRDKLRAENALQQRFFENKIPVIWDSVLKEIRGEKKVDAVVIENIKNGKVSLMNVDGVFIAIGYSPNNAIIRDLGVETDAEGYIKVDQGYRTNIKGIYAAGDITGGIKQITTAVGQATVAAITIFEDIKKPYWKEKKT